MKPLPVALLLACLVLTAGPAGAAPVGDLEAPVEPGSSLTYLKLVRNIFKGAEAGGDKGEAVTAAEKALRRPGSKERTVIPAETPLDSFQALEARGDGRSYLVLFFMARTQATEVPGGDAAIVAIFPRGGAEAQDVAEVKTDAFCSLNPEAPPALGPDDAFAVMNHHSNSNQSYQDLVLYHVRKGRLARVASVFLLSTMGACRDSFKETLAWRAQGGEGGAYPKLTAEVTLVTGPWEEERAGCPAGQRANQRRAFSQSFAWDAGKDRYQALDKGLEGLDRFNRDRF